MDASFEYYKIAAVVLVTASLGLLFYSLRNIKTDIPEDDRVYMDPLPRMLRMIWPLVQIMTYYIGERIPTEALVKYNKIINKSGVSYLITAEQFVGVKVASSLLTTLFAYLCLNMLEMVDPVFLGIALVIGWVLPSLTLNDIRKRREKEIVRTLPNFLDFITMSVEAGMNFSGSLAQAVDKAPPNALRDEFYRVIRDMKAGMARVDAIKAMGERLDVREIQSFVTAIVQAEKTGASIGATLKIQADQRRIERFQRAEKLAMEAPVKLIFPLVAFIFPTTFIIIGFPIAMKLLHEM